jgi:hypothetical protein
MKIRLLFAFVRWIFSKMFSKVLKLDETFRDTLREETGLAVFFWVVGTVCSIGVVSLLGAGFIDTAAQFGWFILAQLGVSFLYLVVNGVAIMYEAFKRDRQELFNVLKG